jgi:DNA-binding MarR family transcriptional regulator
MQNGQEYLDVFLIRVCRAHHNLARQSLETIGLHRGQPPLLFALGKQDGLTHSELAEEMEVTPAAITHMVKRLEQAGFVLRQRDTEDGRVSRVYLTDAGRAIHSEMATIARQVNDITFAGFTGEERAHMRGFLDRVQHNLQQAVGKGGPQ